MSWPSEPLKAALRKEWRQEVRTLSGLAVTALFALVGGVIAGVAIFGVRPDPQLIAGLIWLILLFAGAVTLPRAFLIEDETGTTDLLRLIAPPEAVFTAKTIVASGQMLGVAGVAVGAILIQTEIPVSNVPLLIAAVSLGAVAVATTCVLCGALASGAANRAAVAAALAVPLLVFVASLGTTALLPALGDGRTFGWTATSGLLGVAAGNLVIGPPLLKAVWKR